MSQKLKQLKEKLRRAIRKELVEYDNLNTRKEKEIEEASMTGNIDGGEGPPKTPYAFQSKTKRGQDKKKEDEISTNSTGFIKMNENKLNELTDKQWTQALKHFIGNRYFPTMLKTAKSILKDRDEKRLEVFVGANYRYFKNMAKIYNLRLTEGSINEGRYHDWRNDESLNPKQKIGRSMREIRDALNELDKTVKMNLKLKTELNMNSQDYWKNTHKALTKISERLVKMANKIGNLKWNKLL